MIGDVLTTSALFKVLKQHNPNAILHYVVNKHTIPVIENNPFIDELKIINPETEKSFAKLLEFSKALKQENYDAVVDIYGLYSSNLISLFCGAKQKIAKKKWYTKFIYTDFISETRTPITNAGLALENRLRYLKPLGYEPEAYLNKKRNSTSGYEPDDLKPTIYLTNQEIDSTKVFLEKATINLEKPLYMISVIGSDQTKTYPFEYMAKVLDKIVSTKPEAQLLFNYIPSQLDDAKAIYNLCQAETQSNIRLDVFGKSLREFICITHFCTALIGNEGGAVNMAKALNVPTFTIFSPWIKKATWSVFEDDKNVSVHLKDYNETLINTTEKLKANFKTLYDAFKPDFFLEKLKQFLTQ